MICSHCMLVCWTVGPLYVSHRLSVLLLCDGLCSKGISRSSAPYVTATPSWVAATKTADVEALIEALAKKGVTASKIGVILRDRHSIPLVKHVTGTKIVRILKKKKLAPEIPEDLYFLIKKAVNVRKHLTTFRKDKDSKYRVILIESRIHRLSRYYRATRQLPGDWKYERSTAATLVS